MSSSNDDYYDGVSTECKSHRFDSIKLALKTWIYKRSHTSLAKMTTLKQSINTQTLHARWEWTRTRKKRRRLFNFALSPRYINRLFSTLERKAKSLSSDFSYYPIEMLLLAPPVLAVLVTSETAYLDLFEVESLSIKAYSLFFESFAKSIIKCHGQIEALLLDFLRQRLRSWFVWTYKSIEIAQLWSKK